MLNSLDPDEVAGDTHFIISNAKQTPKRKLRRGTYDRIYV